MESYAEGGDEGPQARKIRELQEVLKALQVKLKKEGQKTQKLNEALISTEKLLREAESVNNNLIKHRALKDKMLASAKEAFMEYASIVCTGAGYFSRFLGRQYVFEAILEQVLGVSPQTASTAAWVAAAIEVLFRTGTEYDVHQEYFKGVLNSFSLSHLVDYKFARKAASGISWINGGFVALTGAVATFMKLKQYAIPIPLQALCIVPAFILDQGSATELSREKTQNLITAAITTEWCGCASGKKCLKSCSDCCRKKSIERKRTWCHYWVLRCVEIIKVANAATINKLSVIALDAK
ncbi:MAG: hypothetical protein K2X39_05735 [Silvanigrellaceae bacterium]|nr:hypothetical protein [Silvanigrellaceae bacterium]